MSIPAFETARKALVALDLYHDFYAGSVPFHEEKQRIITILRATAANTPADRFLPAFADALEKM